MFQKKYIVPTISSIGTLFSGVGLTWFGVKKILDYIYHEDTPPEVALAGCLTFMIGSGIIIAETRTSAIFRRHLREKSVPPKEADEAKIEIDIDLDSVIAAFVHEAPEAPPPFGYRVILNTIKFSGMCGIVYSSVPSFLGTITLFETIGGDPTEQNYSQPVQYLLQGLIYAGAAVFVFGKLNSAYCFGFNATCDSAKNVADWVYGFNQTQSRAATLKNYAITLGLCSFNILSSPFVAYYSIEQTLLKIPGINNSSEFIAAMSGFGAFNAFLNDLLTKSPSVRKALCSWWRQDEEGRYEINVLNQHNFASIKTLNAGIIAAGIIDSVGTGGYTMISVIKTAHRFFSLNPYADGLIFFAAVCGTSGAMVNGSYSVRRGHEGFLKNEVYNFYKKRGYLKADNNLQEALLVEDSAAKVSQVGMFKNLVVVAENPIHQKVATHSIELN